ncbi:hypothetical protein WN944_000833 [Citrus x changshan-huyou]|uniref:Uncharacterized protein n=1 Tax=Citrus x changshan-huyou TaxID=2935761 RepID=A0AAP0MDK0_9ROSI
MVVLYEMIASRESLENRRNSVDMMKLIGSHHEAENRYHADTDHETFKLLQLTSTSYTFLHFLSAYKGESLFTFARDVTLKSTKAMMQPPIPKDLDPWGFRLLRASWTKSTCTYIIIFFF